MSLLDNVIKKFRLRGTLAVVMIVLAIIPATFLTLLVTKNATEQQQQETTFRLINTGAAITQNIDLFLNHHKDAIASLAKVLTQTNSTTREELETWLAIYHEKYPNFSTMLTTDALGVISSGHPNMTRDGEPYDPTGKSVSDRSYYTEAINSDKAFISEVFLGRGFGQEPIVGISSAFGSPTRGIVEGSLDLKRFARFKNNFEFYGAELLILDQDARVVYTSFETETPILTDMSSTTLFEPHTSSNTWTYKDNGKEYYVVAKRGELGWIAVLRLPIDYLQEFSRTQYIFLAIWLIITLIILVIAVIRFSGSVTRPLERLERQLRNFNPNAELSPGLLLSDEGPFEVQSLNKHFHNLRLRLNASYQQTQQVLEEQETTIKERTVELEQSMIEAKAASDAKSSFLANMSHEIRTPMNAVIGLTEMMLGNHLSKKQHERALTIKSSATATLGIINDILDFSKIEAGKLAIENHVFNFEDFMNEFIASVSSSTHSKNLVLNYTIDPELTGYFEGDSYRIRQILTNLVGNAIKFTEKGSIGLKSIVKEKHQNHCLVYFEVEDTGVGIGKEEQKSIFRRFTQADSSITRVYGGTGLGLSICQQLTALMGGEVGFSSEENKGSTFWFTVKLDKVKDYDTKSNRLNKEALATPKAEAKVLIVDDNETNLFVAQEMLEHLGLKINTALNGQEAINKLKEAHYDLVIMDCHMPLMDGYEATRQIRLSDFKHNSPNIPIIALTASAMKGDKERCLAAGMDEYLTKPIDIEALQKKLATLLPQSNPLNSSNAPNVQKQEPKAAAEKETSSPKEAESLAETEETKPEENSEEVSQSTDGNSESEPVFEFEDLKKRLKLDESIIKNLIDGFYGKLDGKLDRLNNAIENKQFEEIVHAAHDLKGSFANLGFMKTSHIMKVIEAAGKEENLDEILQYAEKIEASVAESKAAYPKYF